MGKELGVRGNDRCKGLVMEVRRWGQKGATELGKYDR